MLPLYRKRIVINYNYELMSYRPAPAEPSWFEGILYNDDRLFVLHVAKCTVLDRTDGFVDTTVYHDAAPGDHIWCLLTLRNTVRYPATRVDHFVSRDDAEQYRRLVEPTVPRISLGGNSPAHPLSFEEYSRWKAEHHLVEYDYRKMVSGTGSNPREIITTKKLGEGSEA